MRKNKFVRFTRFFLSMAIAFSAIAGYIAFKQVLDIEAFYVFTGVLFMATGASALNQFQEKDRDALMKRTQNRPLPKGEISTAVALRVILVLCFGGASILLLGNNLITALLGVFNILWYNGVYTPLKKVTKYAVVVGALTGSIPPMMGWVAAGGNIFSPDILIFGLFMFLWQIPHFWLLLLKFGKDYENAGFPSISSIGERQVQIVIFIWVIFTAISTAFFPVSRLIISPHLITGLVLVNALLIEFFIKNIFIKGSTFQMGKAFRSLYLYQVLILVLVIVQALQ